MTKYFFIVVCTCFVAILLLSCGSMARLKKADKHYEIGEYFAAASLYRKAYGGFPSNKRELRGYSAFRQGECYRLTNKPQKAVTAYQTSIRCRYTDSLLYLQYARVLQEVGNYDEAKKMYKAYLNGHSGSQLALNGILACEKLSGWKNIKTEYVVKLAGELNSKNASDFSPLFVDDEGSAVIFSSSRPNITKRKQSAITGFSQDDLYLSQKDVAGNWDKPQPMDAIFNTDFDEGTASVSGDGKTLYFSRCPYEAGKSLGAQILSSVRSGGEWAEPSTVVLFRDSSVSVSHPAVTYSGDTLYFVSDQVGGYGGKDIWMSVKMQGKWSHPLNLGPTINTSGDEMFPYAHPDGSLYFSSNGHPGLGGLDIFHAIKKGEGSWEVINLMPPFNSNADDFGITFERKRQKGYFSSNRNESRGYDKIWSFILPEKEYALSGVITDNTRQRLGDAILRIVGTNGTNVKMRTKKDGTFYFKVVPGVDYVLLATCRGYLNQQKELSTRGLKESKTYQLAFQLPSIGKPIPLDNIFFEFGKSTLNKESEVALKGLVKIMKDNPTITIELAAHTDMVGSADANLTLSEKRIQAVVDYLIATGVSQERVTGKGYGESMPVTVDATMATLYSFLKEGTLLDEAYVKTLTPEQQEIANKINRRTEFRVVKTTYGLR